MVQEIINKKDYRDNADKKRFTREQLNEFISEIEKRMVISQTPFIHSMLALNDILRRPETEELFDEDLKQRARDIWVKIKSAGLRLNNPPFLFEGHTGLTDGAAHEMNNGSGNSGKGLADSSAFQVPW